MVGDQAVVREVDVAPVAVVVVALALARGEARIGVGRGFGVRHRPRVEPGPELPAKVESNRVTPTAAGLLLGQSGNESESARQSERQDDLHCSRAEQRPVLLLLLLLPLLLLLLLLSRFNVCSL